MKKRVIREEVSQKLVTDAYVESKHSPLRFRQTMGVIITWILVFVPFIWLSIPFFFPMTADWLDFRVYFEERLALLYLVIFLVSAFLFLSVLFVLMTRRNNRRSKQQLQKSHCMMKRDWQNGWP